LSIIITKTTVDTIYYKLIFLQVGFFFQQKFSSLSRITNILSQPLTFLLMSAQSFTSSSLVGIYSLITNCKKYIQTSLHFLL